MIEETRKKAQTRMQKSLEALQHSLAKIRTGRAHPSLIESIMVPYYGNPTALSQVANINVEDARTLTVSPWEKPMIGPIEKAIRGSDLGLNPMNTGDLIRIPLPPLTEERRRELLKHVKNDVEEGKVAIRNIRRDANGEIKELLKKKDITEDEERRAQDTIQKLTDKFIQDVDKVFTNKETELLHV